MGVCLGLLDLKVVCEGLLVGMLLRDPIFVLLMVSVSVQKGFLGCLSWVLGWCNASSSFTREFSMGFR